MTTINNCPNRLSSKDSSQQTKSMIINNNNPQGKATQMDVELIDLQSIVLEQNVPNPFAEQTSINYSLPDNTGKAQMLFFSMHKVN